MGLIPTKNQWQKWSLPSKYTAIGLPIAIVGIIVSVVFGIYPKQDNYVAIDQEEISRNAKATKDMIEELLIYGESIPPLKTELNDPYSDILIKLSQQLKINPYNVRALITRGQVHYITSTSLNRFEYRKAIRDFENAIKENKNAADPYYGLGTIYYLLANLDMVRRELYKIHGKGRFHKNPENEKLERFLPAIEIYPDERVKTMLLAALNQFQIGKKLKSIMRTDKNEKSEITTVFFDPETIDNRIKSIRSILKYDPTIRPDLALDNAFSMCYCFVVPQGILDLYDLSAPENE